MRQKVIWSAGFGCSQRGLPSVLLPMTHRASLLSE